jgi:cytochrome P450 family 110
MQVPRSVLPPTLQLVQWVFYPLEYMEIYSQRFGDLFQFESSPINPETYVMVGNPEAIQYLFTHDNSDHLSVPGSVNLLAKPLFGENSVVLLDGQTHRQRRKLLMPLFHGDFLKGYSDKVTNLRQSRRLEKGNRSKRITNLYHSSVIRNCSIRWSSISCS